MPKQAYALTAFNGGELSPRMDGRVDFDKYPIGCKTLENFLPTVQGPLIKRPGSHYVDSVLDPTARPWIKRFEFDAAQSFLLEFCDDRLGFFTNRGRLLAARTITGAVDNGVGLIRLTSAAHGFLTGDSVTVASVGGVPAATGTWTVTRINANSFDLQASAFAGLYTVGGTATAMYTLATPYTDAALTNDDGGCALSTVQIGDVVYMAGGGQPPQKLARSANTSWALTEYQPDTGPYLDQNTDEAITVYASAQTGSVTLTAASSIFTANHVGVLFRLDVQDLSLVRPWEPGKAILLNELRRSDGKTYKALNASTTGTVRPTHSRDSAYDGSDAATGVKWSFQDPGYGVCRITAYTSGTSVTATVLTDRLPDATVTAAGSTWRWSFGAWGDHNEYPTRVAVWRERIVWAGARTVWLGVTGDFEDMSPDEFGQQLTDSAIAIIPAADENNLIRWLASVDALMVGTAAAEFAIQPQTDSEPFGPANRKAPQQSGYGGRDVAPARVGDAVFFVDRSGRKVREIRFDVDVGAYQVRDVTIIADHITTGGIVSMAYQKSPDNILWAVRADGVLLAFTYEREQNVYAWHRHPVGGDGIVEDVAVIPAPDGSRDDVWLLVRRTINGATVRYVEYLDPGYQDGDAIEDAFYLDCALTYDGAPADTISGLGHLEGETVRVLADGARHPDCVVTAGAITLQRDASVVHAGLAYASRYRSMRLEAGAADGAAQGRHKTVSELVFRFVDTVGGTFGPDFNTLDEIAFRTAGDPMDQPIPPFTGDKSVTFHAGGTTDGLICFEHDEPLPCTLVAIFPRVRSTG